jgi:hypothetical protein
VAAFSIAAASSGVGFRFPGHARSIGRKASTFNQMIIYLI